MGAFAFVLFVSYFYYAYATRMMSSELQEQPILMRYHNGPLLAGPISVDLLWYGNFTVSQRAVVYDFFSSLTSPESPNSVSKWWGAVRSLYHLSSQEAPSATRSSFLRFSTLDDAYSFGKSLRMKHIVRLASKVAHQNSVPIVLTSSDVTVAGFCMSRCGAHGFRRLGGHRGKMAYIWVGNSERQCPGHCAWPFHQPIYGPQNPPLVPPNNDVGMDGMIINLASLLAGTITNPFGDGYFQGPLEAPLEAASACAGTYGKGSYPGFTGELLVDSSTGASYNAHGINGRNYLLPAIFNPLNSQCWTLG